ncbi:MAG: hypothetical protein ABL957_14160 [Parvularculaceae bacterium]
MLNPAAQCYKARMAAKKDEGDSVEQIERRLDRALRRSFKMPPPAHADKEKQARPATAKRANARKRAPSA